MRATWPPSVDCPADQTNGVRAVDWDHAMLQMPHCLCIVLRPLPYRFCYQPHTPEDAKLNELIDATNASANVADQIAAFKALTKYENESMFTMALYYQPIYVITSDKVQEYLLMLLLSTALTGKFRIG